MLHDLPVIEHIGQLVGQLRLRYEVFSFIPIYGDTSVNIYIYIYFYCPIAVNPSLAIVAAPEYTLYWGVHQPPLYQGY